MNKYLVLIATIVVMLFTANLPSAVCASVVVDRVIAVVNGEVITLSDLQREAAKNNQDKIEDGLLLEEMINRKLQVAAAKRAGIDVTEKELNDALSDIMKRNSMDNKQFEDALVKEGLTLEQYRAELREQITLSRTFSKYIRSGIGVEEAEIREYYQKNRKNYVLPEEIRVRHIFIKIPDKDKAAQDQMNAAREKAQAVYERAKKGEDFISLVKQFSMGDTVTQDGDLGFMQREHALPEIEKAARILKPGDIAGPLQGTAGFHIIKLEEIRTPVRPFEKVKDEIQNIIYQQKLENTYRAWLQTLRSESHIENHL